MSPSVAETGASSVTYAVSFSTSVTGVGATDFKVTTAVAAQAAAPVVVAGSGAAYTVTINGIHGSGQLRLDFIDDDSIQDGSNTPLGGTGIGNGSFQGQSYDVLQLAPVVVTITRLPFNPVNTTATSVTFQATFSTAVTGVDPTDFQLASTGTVSASLIQTTPVSASVYNVTVSGVSGSGTLGLNLVDNACLTSISTFPWTVAPPRRLPAPSPALPTAASIPAR